MGTEESGQAYVPPPGHEAKLIDFDRAVLVSTMIYPPPPPTLVVSGEKPHPAVDVVLVPLVYVSEPPYWGIQVVGTAGREEGLHPMPLTESTQYTVELDLSGVTGTSGVEVIGATRTEQLEVPATGAEASGVDA
jgi:hypothetical protein